MTDTETVITQFNEAFRIERAEKLVDIIADDCVMEGVGPAPTATSGRGMTSAWPVGSRSLRPSDALRRRARGRRRRSRRDPLAAAPRRSPSAGVNLMRVRDGKIVEALGYGKRP